MLLGVNIDHVATLRNARGGNEPDVLTAARITRKNAWLVQFVDEEDKQNIVLQYDLNKF